MSGNAKFALFAGVLFVVIVCSWAIGIFGPEKTTGTIEMVQPCGWFWCAGYDSHYAQNVNLPNSQANSNNGEAAVSFAQATQITGDAIKSQTQTATAGAMFGFYGALCLVGVFLFLALMLKARGA